MLLIEKDFIALFFIFLYHSEVYIVTSIYLVGDVVPIIIDISRNFTINKPAKCNFNGKFISKVVPFEEDYIVTHLSLTILQFRSVREGTDGSLDLEEVESCTGDRPDESLYS